MLTLEELIANDIQQSKIWEERMYQYEGGVYKFSLNFYNLHKLLAVQEITKGQFEKAKQNFIVCGLIDELRINNFNDRLLDYGLDNISYVILSDNELLVQRYSKLLYKQSSNAEVSMQNMVLNGGLPIWCNTCQMFLSNDTAAIERNLNIIETITLKKLSYKEEYLRDDYEFYVALYDENRVKMEEILEKLISPKIHKKRNTNPISNKCISLPATAYAKLAWRKGIELQVNSNLIPKKLLSLLPSVEFEIPYNFLRDHV